MNKIEGTVIASGLLESGEHATCGVVIWTTNRQKAGMERWNGQVVVERKADHDAREAELAAGRRMKQTVYVVHAYRWGDRECHSYGVGVFSTEHAALKAAQNELYSRGGKYQCEIIERTIDAGTEGGPDTRPRIVQALPSASELQERSTSGLTGRRKRDERKAMVVL